MSASRPSFFEQLEPEERAELEQFMGRTEFEAGAEILREGWLGDTMFVIERGRANVFRSEVLVAHCGPGDVFGELGLITERPRTGTVRADTRVACWRLTRDGFRALTEQNPRLAVRFLSHVIDYVRLRLADTTESARQLLAGRGDNGTRTVDVQVRGEEMSVLLDTPVGDLLPAEVDGDPVVAALVNRRATWLRAPITAPVTVEPLGRSTVEGRPVYRTSAALLLLEAARRLDRALRVRVGPSLGFAYVILVDDLSGYTLDGLADALRREMWEMVRRAVPFRREVWTVEEAGVRLEAQGWHEAVRLLRASRDTGVTLVSCGTLYALGGGPTVPSADYLDAFDVVPHAGGLLLSFGGPMPSLSELGAATSSFQLAREHDHWLETLGVTSVGALNDTCVAGAVSNLIQVSEGFHEKAIGRIADQIHRWRTPIRVICVAGPSSSGKTTFIQRLRVQLQVLGYVPHSLSLDDYFVDRARTVRHPDGTPDYEAFEALDGALLDTHLSRLVAGERVRTARYDFKTGQSDPAGGPEIELLPGHILLVEGIHALSPRLPVNGGDRVFRVFINPMTSLALDHLTRVSVSDVRLLRRLVRDRYARAKTATDTIEGWPSVRSGEERHIFPNQYRAHAVFNSSLAYEVSVLHVYAERYLLEVPDDHPAQTTAFRLRRLIDHFVPIYPDHVPPTSLLREFIGGAFEG